MSVALSLLVLTANTRAAIATNSSITTTVGWVSDPTGRGTFSLIFTCLLTLGLCVWSAMHLNIPSHDESTVQTWTRNFKWGLVGVVAPELVVYAAWRQYNSAQTLHAEVQRHLNTRKPVLPRREEGENSTKEASLASGLGSIESINSWTMVHSFYAGMGGFTIELDSSADRGSPFIPGEGIQRLTLTARGIALLAKCGYLPNIYKDDIIDKSKADGLAKSLVCIQAGWMVAQAVGRVALGLPVTLLEVNIIGHVLCALVIYLLWWHKPRLIHESTKLEGAWVRPICAYMYMSSQVSGWRSSHAGILRRTWVDPELSALAFFIPRTQGELPNATTEGQPILTNGLPSATMHDSTDSSRRLHNACDWDPDGSGNFAFFGPRPLPFSPTEDFVLSSSAEEAQNPCAIKLTRWHLAADAVHRYPAIAERFAPESKVEPRTDGYHWLEPLTEELVTRSASNWPSEDLLRGTGGLVMGMVLWFASMAYGGVHIAAWNDYFPSTVEAWLWRSSSIYITSSAFLWLLINLLAHLFKPIDAYWERVLALQSHWISYLVLGTLCSVCGLAYAFARIFLVVEAFISIRELPLAAYATPDWTQLIPHM